MSVPETPLLDSAPAYHEPADNDWQAWRQTPSTPLQISAIKPLNQNVHQEHRHSANCGCGHKHVASDSEIAAATTWKTQFAVVAAMGMRPCSGAILVLLFSKVIGVYGWGILAAMAMAAGTALTISGIALLVGVPG